MSGALRMTPEWYAAHQAKRAAECAKDDGRSSEYIENFAGLGTLRIDKRQPSAGDNIAEVIRYGAPIYTHYIHRPRQFLLTLPYPPTLNSNTLPVVGGGRILTQEHRNFRALVAQIVFAANIKRLDGKLSVTINVYPPDARARDIDNIVKPTLDALQRAGAILNDANIDELVVRRVTTSERPRTAQVVVTVREIA